MASRRRRQDLVDALPSILEDAESIADSAEHIALLTQAYGLLKAQEQTCRSLADVFQRMIEIAEAKRQRELVS